MAAIARAAGVKAPRLLLTSDATRPKTFAAIRAAAKKLKKGDLFFLTYSGHGGQIPDVTGEEEDRRDETWCLYDGELIDDELYFELSRFGTGVRILVLSDSCHSGTVTRARVSAGAGGPAGSKMMPPSVADATYARHQKFYDGLQTSLSKVAGKPIADPDNVLAALARTPRTAGVVSKLKPAVILLAGCQDNQTSLDGDPNSAFTAAVMKVWDNGAFEGDYVKFYSLVMSELPASQTPNLFTLGPVARYLRQQVFTV